MRETKTLRPGVSGIAFSDGVLMERAGKIGVVMRAVDGTMIAKTGYMSGSGGMNDQSLLVDDTAELAGCQMAVLAMEALILLVPCIALFTPLPDLPLWLFPLEATARIGLALLYCVAVTRTRMGNRLRMYHGAEHKAVNCYSSGCPLTLDNARTQSRRSAYCGSNSTAAQLALMALFASLADSLPLRLLALPALTAASKWIWQYAQRHNSKLARCIVSAGMALQRINTAEPTDEMLEVAVKALRLVKQKPPGPPKAGRARVRKRRVG